VTDNRNSDPDRRRSAFVIRGGSGIFVGLFLLALGVVLLLDQQGVVSAHRVFQYFWPALLIFFGLENLTCRSGSSKILGGAMLVIGVLMILGNLGYIPFHIGFATIWPLLLIVVGLVLLAKRIVGKRIIGIGMYTRDSLGGAFSGVKQRILTKNFKGGKIVAALGGFELDMRQAGIEGDSAVIQVTAFMGGGSIRVPENWTVDFQGTPFLGGLVDEREHLPPVDSEPAKRLIIRGLVCMGGVVIKS